MKRRISSVVMLATLLVLAATQTAIAGILYTITDLGSVGGFESIPYAISNSGKVAGTTKINPMNVISRGFLYDIATGQTTLLGTLGGQHSYGAGVNDLGQVVGLSNVQIDRQAYLYDGTRMINLGTLGGRQSGAMAINDYGKIVGWADPLESDRARAFLYENGRMTDLGTFGGTDSAAYNINNRGQVVGQAMLPDGSGHAFLYENGRMTDLNPLGIGNSAATAINDRGDITIAGGRGFLYADGVATELDSERTLHPMDINNRGEIVGRYHPWPEPEHAFLWRDGALFDLNDFVSEESGWLLTEATAINDSGYIVGYGLVDGQYPRGFLLTPVPEPASLIVWSLLGASGIGFGWWRRKRTVP